MQRVNASLRVAAVLMAFWILLSGKFDAVHLGAGIAASLGIAFATQPLRELHPKLGVSVYRPMGGVRWGSALLFLIVLAREIVVSSLQVAYLVLHPRLPIDPRMLRFRAGLPHPLARLALGNAITLTPGTVTIDVEGDDFLVHALTPENAAGIETGSLAPLVTRMFAPRSGAAEDA